MYDMGKGLVNGTRGVVLEFQKLDPDEYLNIIGDRNVFRLPGHHRTPDFRSIKHDLRFPVVRFQVRDKHGRLEEREIFIVPETWDISVSWLPPLLSFHPSRGIPIPHLMWFSFGGKLSSSVPQSQGKVSASRTQVPLMLAWSLTIHKCQGMTVEPISLDLSGTFSDGQAYVALSRVRNLEGLYLAPFDPKKVIRANDKALQFYESITRSTGVQSSAVCEAQKEGSAAGKLSSPESRPDLIQGLEDEVETFMRDFDFTPTTATTATITPASVETFAGFPDEMPAGPESPLRAPCSSVSQRLSEMKEPILGKRSSGAPLSPSFPRKRIDPTHGHSEPTSPFPGCHLSLTCSRHRLRCDPRQGTTSVAYACPRGCILLVTVEDFTADDDR